MRVTVPGNLLLLGEYAIVDKGGLGVAVAIDKSVRGSSEASRNLLIRGVMGPQCVEWSPEYCHEMRDFPFFSAIYTACQRVLSIHQLPSDFPAQTYTVDSSAFFDQNGAKFGFGSSAASAVALSFMLCASVCSDMKQAKEIAYQAALLGHRNFQGGKGSGYDITTSFYGGAGLFVGGETPAWQVLDPPWRDTLHIIRGEKPVSSAKAVLGYKQWCRSNPDMFDKFYRVSNRIVKAFAKAKKMAEAAHYGLLARRCGLWIGRKLGVEPEPSSLAMQLRPLLESGFFAKASGAGGEMGVAFPGKNGYTTSTPAYAENLLISDKGLEWEL